MSIVHHIALGWKSEWNPLRLQVSVSYNMIHKLSTLKQHLKCFIKNADIWVKVQINWIRVSEGRAEDASLLEDLQVILKHTFENHSSALQGKFELDPVSLSPHLLSFPHSHPAGKSLSNIPLRQKISPFFQSDPSLTLCPPWGKGPTLEHCVLPVGIWGMSITSADYEWIVFLFRCPV